MLIVDSQARIQILTAKHTISGFRAVGHTLTAENKHRDEVKYDIGHEFELNRESKRLNIFAILGSGEELNMFRSDISQTDYLAEYGFHKLYEPKSFGAPKYFLKNWRVCGMVQIRADGITHWNLSSARLAINLGKWAVE